MYQIYADETLIYDSTIEDYKIGRGSVSLETNKSGSFTFSIYPDHFFYDSFVKLKTIITVYKSGKIIFRGRILNDVTDYWNNKVITCEGELGFLQDSIIRPFSFAGTPEELFIKFVNEHNSQVDEFKRFKIGTITVLDPNGYIARSNSGYESALSNMNSRLIEDSLGGYIHITHGEDGKDPIPTIHYLADFTKVATQTIQFGANLKDYTKTVKSEGVVTAIIPLGAEIDDGDDNTENPKLTIARVNDGVDYVYDEEAVATYGWIFAVVEWKDVTDPNNLKRKAEAYLAEAVKQSITIELNAIDLHLLDHSIESFKVGDYVRVISEPHNFAETMLCHKQTIDLLKPENDTVTLGHTFSSFTETNVKLANRNSNSISSVYNSINQVKGSVSQVKNNVTQMGNDVANLNYKTDRYKIAEQQLAGLMSRSFGVFNTEEVLEDGSTIHYMHDKPKLEDSRNIWKMTENVFAVSSDGGKTWNAGFDSAGNAILNILSVIGINATWLNVDNLLAISANLGGWQIDNEKIFKEWRQPNLDVGYRICLRPPAYTSSDGGSTYEPTVPFLSLERKFSGSAEYEQLVDFTGECLHLSGPYGEAVMSSHELTISGNESGGTPGMTHIRGNSMRIDDDSGKNRVDIKKDGIFVKDSAGVIRACVEYYEDDDTSYVEADKMNTGDIYGAKGRFNELYANTLTLSAGSPLTEMVSITTEYYGVDMTFTNGLLTKVKYT